MVSVTAVLARGDFDPRGSTLGAYGLALVGLPDGGELLPEPPPSWPRWTVSQRRESVTGDDGVRVESAHAVVGLPGRGEIRLDRERREIVFATEQELSAEAMVHPGLSPAAAVAAWWAGRVCFHAAAVVVDGLAWAFLGDRGRGKSTTASMLVDAGCRLLTDDLLVVEGGRGFAGPGVIDLRREAAAALGGEPMGVVGARERWRQRASRTATDAPLGGFVSLEWSDRDVSLESVAPRDRLELLASSSPLPVQAVALLELLALPVLRLRRPQDLGNPSLALDPLMDRLRR